MAVMRLRFFRVAVGEKLALVSTPNSDRAHFLHFRHEVAQQVLDALLQRRREEGQPAQAPRMCR
jgi:hypothetical protein